VLRALGKRTNLFKTNHGRESICHERKIVIIF